MKAEVICDLLKSVVVQANGVVNTGIPVSPIGYALEDLLERWPCSVMLPTKYILIQGCIEQSRPQPLDEVLAS